MGMPPLFFVAETHIPAPPEEVYAFHLRPDALQLLIPPFERTRVVRPPTGLDAGTEVELVSQSAMSPYIRPYVERDMVLLYEEG